MNFNHLRDKLNAVLEESKLFYKNTSINLSKYVQSKYTPQFLLPSLPALPLDRVINYSSPVFTSANNPDYLGNLLDEAKTVVDAGYFQSDNLFTWGRNNSALEDEVFINLWKKNTITGQDQATLWSEYLLLCLGSHAVHIHGDFVEFCSGVPARIRTMIEYLGGESFSKKVWVYDVSNSNPDNIADPNIAAVNLDAAGLYGYPRDLKHVNYIKTNLNKIPHEVENSKISFLNLNIVDSGNTISLLDTLFDRVVSGGVVVLRFYECSGIYRSHKQLEDQWFASKNYRIIPLPTGQGLVIKR